MNAKVYVVEESRDGGETWEAVEIFRGESNAQDFLAYATTHPDSLHRLATYVRDEASVTKPKRKGKR